VTFNDVAGVDEAKTELQEVVEFLKFPEKFNSLGARIPRGVLLSLAIQSLFAYLIEYFAANYALSDKLVSADGKLTASRRPAPPARRSATWPSS